MRNLSREDSERWLEEQRYSNWQERSDDGWPWVANIELHRASASMPIARHLHAWIERGSPVAVLVHLYDPHVWRSSENPHLFAIWCRAGKVSSDLYDWPGFLFEPKDTEELLTLIYFAVVAGWGMVIAREDGASAIHVDNDGHVQTWPGPPSEESLGQWLANIPGVETTRPT